MSKHIECNCDACMRRCNRSSAALARELRALERENEREAKRTQRNALMWMLSEAGKTNREIADAFGLNVQTITVAIRGYMRLLEKRMLAASFDAGEAWERRLRQAGAIATPWRKR